MNFNKRVNGSWVDIPHYIHNTSTDTITTLPAIIYPNDTTATVGLKGNTVQSGTPSPDNPIMPNGTGDKTANLFDKNTMQVNAYLRQNDGVYLVSSGSSYSCLVKIKPNTSYRVRSASRAFRISLFTQLPQQDTIPSAYYNYDKDSYSVLSKIITSGNSDTYLVFFCYSNSWEYQDGKTVDEIMSTVMISEGTEQAVPYEPYGYKIPISINNVVTDIYIGDNPLRKSLDGTAYDTLAADGTLTRRVDSDGSVLPTPIITQVTMPTFTTTPGANTLNVLTTVQPSEVTATFDGWHPVSSAHERSGGSWT